MSSRLSANTSAGQQVAIPDADASVDLSMLNAHIAAELAAGLSTAADVREKYGISDAQWKTLASSRAFRDMLAEAVREWRGDLNAGARIQKKADIVLEDALPAYDAMIHSKDTPAQARIDAGKLLAQLAGRTAKQVEGGGGGGGFVLNINLGDAAKNITVEGTALPAVDAT